MGLNQKDLELVQDVVENVRARFRYRAQTSDVELEMHEGQEYSVRSDDAGRDTRLTKQDFRDVSGRRIIRDAHLRDVAAELNQHAGVSARVDYSEGAVLVRGVPDAEGSFSPMSLADLKREGSHAAVELQSDREDSED